MLTRADRFRIRYLTLRTTAKIWWIKAGYLSVAFFTVILVIILDLLLITGYRRPWSIIGDDMRRIRKAVAKVVCK